MRRTILLLAATGTVPLAAGALAPAAGAATLVTALASEVDETSADGFVTDYDWKAVGGQVMLHIESTGAAGPNAGVPLTLYRCPASKRKPNCRTADPAATAGWKVAANLVTGPDGVIETLVPLDESTWYAATVDGVPADAGNNAILRVGYPARGHWNDVVKVGNKRKISATGTVTPAPAAGTVLVVLEARRRIGGTPVRLATKRAKATNGKFTIAAFAKSGTWYYRWGVVPVVPDRFQDLYVKSVRYTP